MRINRTWALGFHRHGNCWQFRFSLDKYANQTFYTFWRFFAVKEHNP